MKKKLIAAIVVMMFSVLFNITSFAKEVAVEMITVGMGPETNTITTNEPINVTENNIIVQTVEIKEEETVIITSDKMEEIKEDAAHIGPAYKKQPEQIIKDFKYERLQYYLNVLMTMDDADRQALQSVCYNESIRAWSGADYVNDHNYDAMLNCTAGVIETVLNRLGDTRFGAKNKISKICTSGQFVRYPNRGSKPEFEQALALVISKYENGETILPLLDYEWFSSDCKAGKKKSSATSGTVTMEDTVWIGEYRADGTPRKGFGHWYRRVF